MSEQQRRVYDTVGGEARVWADPSKAPAPVDAPCPHLSVWQNADGGFHCLLCGVELSQGADRKESEHGP